MRNDKLFIRCLRDGPSRLRSVNSPDLFDMPPIRIWTGETGHPDYGISCIESAPPRKGWGKIVFTWFRMRLPSSKTFPAYYSLITLHSS
jgi:hypothetical protein